MGEKRRPPQEAVVFLTDGSDDEAGGFLYDVVRCRDCSTVAAAGRPPFKLSCRGLAAGLRSTGPRRNPQWSQVGHAAAASGVETVARPIQSLSQSLLAVH